MSGYRVLLESGGIESALHLSTSIPGKVVSPAIHETLLELQEKGKEAMARSILLSSTTEKATGEIAESIEGYLRIKEIDVSDPTQISMKYVMEIGSSLRKAFYASQDISQSVINLPVQVMPGRWRFIGVRPPMPKHPFLEETATFLTSKILSTLQPHLDKLTVKLQREVDQLKGSP